MPKNLKTPAPGASPTASQVRRNIRRKRMAAVEYTAPSTNDERGALWWRARLNRSARLPHQGADECYRRGWNDGIARSRRYVRGAA